MVAVSCMYVSSLLQEQSKIFRKKEKPHFTVTYEKFAKEWMGSGSALSSSLSSDCLGHFSSPDISSITYKKISGPFHL